MSLLNNLFIIQTNLDRRIRGILYAAARIMRRGGSDTRVVRYDFQKTNGKKGDTFRAGADLKAVSLRGKKLRALYVTSPRVIGPPIAAFLRD